MPPIPVVNGYHGTSAQHVAAILQHGFRASRNRYDWLGDGIYFWQDAPARAWEWATARWGAQAAVVGARLRLDACLDMLDIRWEGPLIAAFHALVGDLQQRGRPVPVQTTGAHRLDRAAVNFAVRLAARHGVTIGVVRAAFQEGLPVYPGSYFHHRSHVQIAVRDLSLIEHAWREPPPPPLPC